MLGNEQPEFKECLLFRNIFFYVSYEYFLDGRDGWGCICKDTWTLKLDWPQGISKRFRKTEYVFYFGVTHPIYRPPPKHICQFYPYRPMTWRMFDHLKVSEVL